MGRAGKGDNPDAAVSGKITFDRWRLSFQSDSLNLEIPLVRLQIQVDMGEEQNVSFFDPEQPGLWVQTEEMSILDERTLLMQANTRNQVRSLKAGDELKSRLRIIGWFAVAFVAIAVIGSLLTGMVVTSLVNSIPPSWEKEIGDEAMADLKKEHTFIQDPKALLRLDRGISPLLDSLPKNTGKYQFYLMEFPLPNAFALPGGHVVVTTGLLDIAGRPEELAGVVAHEIAHVNCKHGFRKIVSSLGPYLLLKLFVGNSRGLLGLLGEGSGLLVSQSFSQEYELEADSVGWDYMLKADIDPRGMIDILMKLKVEQDRMQLGQAEIQAFSSHPATEKRISRLEKKWSKLKKKQFPPLGRQI
jgi:Zn-dependent protease with chaperone function